MTERPDFDFSAELSDEAVSAQPGPLSGSRSRAKGDSAGTGNRTTTTTRRRASSKRLETLQIRLSQEMFQAGTLLGLGLPVTGIYVCGESDAFTKAVVELASTRAEWVEALEVLANIQPVLVVARTAAGIGAAMAVDRGRVDPKKTVLAFLGVKAAYDKIYNPSGPSAEEGSSYVPPPRTFQPV